jgi:hypothetical protein
MEGELVVDIGGNVALRQAEVAAPEWGIGHPTAGSAWSTRVTAWEWRSLGAVRVGMASVFLGNG